MSGVALDVPSPSAATSVTADAEPLDLQFSIPGVLPLHHGGQLAGVRVAYRLIGPADAPVVAVMGGISAGRRVADTRDQLGWWGEVVGPGLPLDTGRYRVLGLDFLGGSHATTGPESEHTFPTISTFDQAEILRHTLDHAGIASVAACVGASYGGMVALAFAVRHPQRVRSVVAISAAHRSHPMSTAWRSVQRAIVRYALTHRDGSRGLQLARALAMATYRSAREFEERFSGPPEHSPAGMVFPVESYLFARGESYAAQYRPEAFVCLSESIDLHRVEPAQVGVPVTLLGILEDQLVPIADLRNLRDGLAGGCRLVEISSIYGHDAFLKEKAVLRDLFAQALE
jgi:homoserine O-acetyltransferase/O-succinyltransferase